MCDIDIVDSWRDRGIRGLFWIRDATGKAGPDHRFDVHCSCSSSNASQRMQQGLGASLVDRRSRYTGPNAG